MPTCSGFHIDEPMMALSHHEGFTVVRRALANAETQVLVGSVW
jgi:hypothetical protein